MIALLIKIYKLQIHYGGLMLIGPVLDITISLLDFCGKADLWFWVRTADLVSGVSYIAMKSQGYITYQAREKRAYFLMNHSVFYRL